jgi:long-chain fatty acid transport protein
MKLNKEHAIGASLILAHQRFSADGLQAFAGLSSSPNDLTNRGNDKANGWGVRIGWTGQLGNDLTLGATYASKTRMGKFNKYKGLFAEQGGFDIPENYGVGIAFKATPKLTVAADIQQINFGQIDSVGNPVNCLGSGCQFGASNGAGFGWRDMTVFKLGASYELSPELTLRAGFSTNRQPIPASQTLLNIVAPGVVENHLTLGATWTLANKSELTIGYMHAFNKTVNGSGSIAATGLPFGPGEVNLHMKQNSLGIAYGWKL